MVRKYGRTRAFTLEMRLMTDVFIIVYVNQRKPFWFQCQQKESRRILNVENELNNMVNKINDFIYSC